MCLVDLLEIETKASSLVEIIYIDVQTKFCLVSGYSEILAFWEIGMGVKLQRRNWIRGDRHHKCAPWHHSTLWPREGQISRVVKITQFFGPKSSNQWREILGATPNKDP